MKPIIRVENVSKRYRIGAATNGNNLRETISQFARTPFKQFRKAVRPTGDLIWALKDVGFEIGQGEVVGLIGRNGAGKSTLLKILSRITEPTTGRIELYGHIGSLLEVGTGFHPELTGRENVFLNGAILGMSRLETQSKFDEIVAFSEVERFIDTPVKHYSSGMYLRLAFSVAAHLDPEVLLVDEVLAVGDAQFQRKCLTKMDAIRQQGSTIIFVSHDMNAIARLCPRTIMLSNGRISHDGPSHEVAAAHLNTGLAKVASVEWPNIDHAPGDDTVRLRAVRVKTEDAQVEELVDIREPILIEIEYDVLKAGSTLSGGIICNHETGVCAFSSADMYPQSLDEQDLSFTGRRVTTCTIPGNFLTEAMFTISVAIYEFLNGIICHVNLNDVVAFRVVDPIEGDTARGVYRGPYAGVVRPFLVWSTKAVTSTNEKATGLF